MDQSPVDFNWLRQAAIRIIGSVHVLGEDGLHYWAPAQGHYTVGCWMRDFAYMLCNGPAEAFAWDQVKRTLERFIGLQARDGAVPDYIILPKYLKRPELDRPATYAVVGGHAAEDNPMFLVLAVDRTCNVLGDDSLLRDNVDALMRGLDCVSRCPASGLVFIDPLDPHSGYGFCDMVDKRGADLFCSLLWWQAARMLAEGLERIGRPERAGKYRQEADWLQMHLVPAFWDEADGLLLAATLRNRQADIWGSAYAVEIGAVADKYADRISDALIANYDRIVRWGQVRHTLSPAWMQLLHECRDYRCAAAGATGQQILPGAYQNGAFWATPTGWFSKAIARKDRHLAQQTVSECIAYFAKQDIYECIDVDETAGAAGRGRVPAYAASAVNVLASEVIFGS